MPANTAPIFPLTPALGVMNVVLSTAMTNTKAFDGTDTTGTALALAYTAGANGSRVDTITVRLTSTNGATASGTSAATLVRFWINNGSANTTATNNQLMPWDVAIPATGVVALDTSVLPSYSAMTNSPMAGGISLPAGFKIYAGTTVAVGGTNIAVLVSVQAGDY
jgi:hypothetical protein